MLVSIMSMLEYASAIAAFSGPIITLFLIKHYTRTEKLIEKGDEILTLVLNEPKLQQKIFQIGALVGNGAKAGLGIKTGNKMKLEDLIVQAGLSFIMPKLNPGQTGEQAGPVDVNKPFG